VEGADQLFFVSTTEGEAQLRAMFTTAGRHEPHRS
jgi:trk system potassium uptake protein TrkA